MLKLDFFLTMPRLLLLKYVWNIIKDQISIDKINTNHAFKETKAITDIELNF